MQSPCHPQFTIYTINSPILDQSTITRFIPCYSQPILRGSPILTFPCFFVLFTFTYGTLGEIEGLRRFATGHFFISVTILRMYFHVFYPTNQTPSSIYSTAHSPWASPPPGKSREPFPCLFPFLFLSFRLGGRAFYITSM